MADDPTSRLTAESQVLGALTKLHDRGEGKTILAPVTAEVIPCEMDECQDKATHTVRIQFADRLEEIFQVCRPHDRQLKTAAVRCRPRARPPIELVPTIRCRDCDQILEESHPCPVCGSRNRVISTSDSMTGKESVVLKAKQPGKGGWLARIKAGDDYTRDLASWGSRKLVMDREGNLYREVIELYDGSRIESSSRLSDHQG